MKVGTRNIKSGGFTRIFSWWCFYFAGNDYGGSVSMVVTRGIPVDTLMRLRGMR